MEAAEPIIEKAVAAAVDVDEAFATRDGDIMRLEEPEKQLWLR